MGNNQALAIIGMGCRFPGGVTDADSYWQLLINRKTGISEVPADRWNWRNYYHPDADIPGRMVTKWGGFLDDHNEFDSSFFGISPREAIQMDVQQRWLLETSWETFENAGIAPGKLKGAKVGVFVGISSHDQIDAQRGDTSLVDIHTGTGNALSISANRISYCFDFKAPSAAVDTACSSALVAVQLACQSIWSGASELALACGVNAILNPSISVSFSRASMLSPTGTCFAFDHRANGYVRSEGVGAILIKPLEQALADGDRIHAVIRAAVVNQDGHSSSLTIPSMTAQESMLCSAYEQANIDTSHVSYVEAHGTGTPVGDPIEARAIGHVLGKDRATDNPCLIGSVKTNIGHLESASGMAGLIKACLILQHQIIPPQLNFEKANPNIHINEIGLEVVSEARPLPHYNDAPAIVGVNSFGFGGTNAHVVLEQAPILSQPTQKKHGAARPFVLPISAQNDTALQAQADSYFSFLRSSDIALEEITSAAGLRRDHLHQRLVVIGGDKDALRSRLLDYLNQSNNSPDALSGIPSVNPTEPVFVFTGQGVQWWGMGQQLMKREPVFHQTIEKIDVLLKPLTGWSLIDEMTRDEEHSRIDDTDVAQPAIFALQVALAEMWSDWGIRPSKVVGHSVGEVAAAYVAGIYSLADAVTVVYHRSRLQHQTGGYGAMIAVGVSVSEADSKINSYHHIVQIGAANSPSMVTLSGEAAAVESLAVQFEADGKFVRRLPINYAFHSYQMDPIQSELLTALAKIQPMPGDIPIISTVTGESISGELMDANYWWRNVREPVRFADAIIRLIQSGETTYLELGPHPALQHALLESLASQDVQGKVFHSLRRDTDESLALLGNLAALHIYGLPVDWAAVNRGDQRFVNLPTYPWQRQTHWHESRVRREIDLEPDEHPLLGRRIASPHPTWELTLDPRILGWLNDHKLWDTIVFPATGYAEMALAVAKSLFPNEPYVVEALEMKKALFVSTNQLPKMQIVFDENDKSVTIYSSMGENNDWQMHARGFLLKFPAIVRQLADVSALKEAMPFLGDGGEFYRVSHLMGYQWGADFQHIQNIWGTLGRSFAEMNLSGLVRAQSEEYCIHPALLDACGQTFSAAGEFTRWMQQGEIIPFLPAEFGRIRLIADRMPVHFWVETRLSTKTDEVMIGDLWLYDDDGNLLAEITDYRFDRVKQRASSAIDVEPQFYKFQWNPRRLVAAPVPKLAFDLTKIIVSKESRQHPLDDYFESVAPALDAVMLQLIQNTLLDLGWNFSAGHVFSLDELMLDVGVIRRWRNLINRYLQALASAGVLCAEGEESWKVVHSPNEVDVLSMLAEVHKAYPNHSAEISLLDALSQGVLAQILRGRLAPSAIFPTNVLNSFHRKGSEAGSIRETVQAVVRQLVEQLPADGPLRVLEIGAGTGALTSTLLSLLPADRTEYTATDVRSKVVKEGQQQFSSYPFVEWRQFDPASDPAAQGLTLHGYDLILNANVIETEPCSVESIAHIVLCLANNGLFIFSENASLSLTPKTISVLLGGNPDINAQGLLELLAESGFRATRRFPIDDAGRLSVGLALAPAIESTAPNLPTQTILLFGNQQGLSVELRDSLRALGLRVITVSPGASFGKEDAESYLVDPVQEDDLISLFAAVNDDQAPLTAIVHAWGLDDAAADDIPGEAMIFMQQTRVLFMLRLAHALDRVKLIRPPQVTILSRDTHSVFEDEDRINGLPNIPIIGFLRVANNEMPSYRWRSIDLDPENTTGEAQDILHEIIFPDAELEIAYRKGCRYSHRLQQVKSDALPAIQRQAAGDEKSFRLQFDKPGKLTNLSINQTTRQQPAAGEIEVRVQAGGINFRDVMKVLGIYPGNSRDLTWLGDDFAGTVISTGVDVTSLKPGDAVVGVAPYAFRSHLTVDHRAAFKMPASLSFEEAATLPTVFLTAYYSIVHLAQMRPGERILIHAGTGGVGQAAIQVAQDIGLEILATAGSPEKRALLKQQGVEHVFDSRSLDFADDVMRVTNGCGVDAVLNSLAGDFIPKNFSVLAPFGRYLEIGKVDVYNNSKIGLEALRSNISVFIIDLAQLMEQRSQDFAVLLNVLRKKFEQGVYRAIPYRVFPVSDAVEAFRYMASGKHVGKNILTFNAEHLAVGMATEEGALFRADVSYLIVGGAGGFGLEVAKWMARQGARHLVLMSRSGPPDDTARADIDALREGGVQVLDARGDVTKQIEVDRIINQIQVGNVPLAGVMHCAMVLHDSMIANMKESDFMDAFSPKALGAWNLHCATVSIPLDYFVLFSSMSSVIGTGGQANYSAGNAFLDGLAAYRRARKLPALAINWGVIGGAGVVARDVAAERYLRGGVKAVPAPIALTALQTAIRLDVAQMGIANVDWNNLSRYLLWVANSGVFDALTQQEVGGGSSGEIAAQIVAAPSTEKQALVEAFISRMVAKVLNISVDQIDRETALMYFGLDSLMTIELINSISVQLNLTLTVSDMSSNATIKDVAAVIVNRVMSAAASNNPDAEKMGLLDGIEAPVDLFAEANLAADIRANSLVMPAVPPSTIFLSGATGFLGAYLLADLMRETAAEVRCLIRAASDEDGMGRLRENLEAYGLWDEKFAARIRPIIGDLAKPAFGLTAVQYQALANDIDVIYHNAAQLNLIQPYAALKPVNVGGVEEMLRLACHTRIKPLHYISTIAVFFSADNISREPVSEIDSPDPLGLRGGYMQSKWVAEQLVRQAHERGIPCTIYRPGIIMGDSQTGATNTVDLASRLIKGSYQLAMTPDQNLNINVVPVDYVSRGIVYLSRQADIVGQVFHLTNPQSTPLNNLINWSGSSQYLRQASYRDWRAALTQQAQMKIENDLLPLLPLFPLDRPEQVEQQIDCQRTVAHLVKAGIECPPLDEKLVDTYMAYLIESGFLDEAVR